MVIWPKLLNWFAHALGIVDMMNGLFVLCIAFIIMILMSITSIVSGQAEKIKNLTQTISKMEKRIRELEERK
jgi:predicted PurR-regulated permease PerM